MKDPMPTPPCPPVSKGLLDHLDGVFPNKLPEIELSGFELGKRVGANQVLNHLRKVQREQEAATTDVYQQT